MYGMKMTMHIDEVLLERVMKSHAYTSKTEAVEMALREMDRKARFREVVGKGMGLGVEELRDSVNPDYDVLAMRVAESSSGYGKRKADKRSR